MTQPLISPCISACTIAAGDDVCRGCKRLLDEIIGWSSYNDSQRLAVWQRLNQLYCKVVDAHLVIDDLRKLQAACVAQQLSLAAPMVPQAWVMVWLRANRETPMDLAAAGLTLLAPVAGRTSTELFTLLDAALLQEAQN